MLSISFIQETKFSDWMIIIETLRQSEARECVPSIFELQRRLHWPFLRGTDPYHISSFQVKHSHVTSHVVAFLDFPWNGFYDEFPVAIQPYCMTGTSFWHWGEEEDVCSRDWTPELASTSVVPIADVIMVIRIPKSLSFIVNALPIPSHESSESNCTFTCNSM